LQGDNTRDLIIELRRKVPALVVDGNQGDAIGPGGDLFHVEVAFFAARWFEAEKRRLEDLGKANLDLYPTIYLLNVGEIKDPAVVQKLDDYVKKGGSIVYFLGDKASPTFYNALFKDRAGLFPILLQPKPTEPLTEEERIDRMQKEEQPKILFPDKKEDMVASLAPFESIFRFLLVDRYWPAAPRFQWQNDPNEPVKELIVLPNRKDVGDYKEQAQSLMKTAITAATTLAQSDKKFEPYVPALENYQRDVRAALGTPYLYQLSVVFDRLLNDTGSERDPTKPNLGNLWTQGAMKPIKAQIDSFTKTIRYGDPLVVSRPHGKGRVVACLTPAGTATKWNNWGGGSPPVAWTFPVFIMDLQRVLTKQSDDLNHIVGESVQFTLDPAKYLPSVGIAYEAQPDILGKAPAGGGGEARPPLKNYPEQSLKLKDKLLDFNFTSSKEPGVYSFSFTPLANPNQKEVRKFSFNVDAAAESDLRRAEQEKLERVGGEGTGSRRGKIRVITAKSDLTEFKARVPDFSESPWLFLLILVILIAEQALAVHLSHHMKGGEVGLAPPATGGAARDSAAAAA